MILVVYAIFLMSKEIYQRSGKLLKVFIYLFLAMLGLC